MHNVRPFGLSMMNIGEVGSQAVYPRASNVERMPPLGKLDASGSLCRSIDPVNFSMGRPSRSNHRNASCFSAVDPVIGWNQWQKCETPSSSAHSFTACAMASATGRSSLRPCSMVSAQRAYTSGESRSRMRSMVATSLCRK